jgi:UDP-N-acetylmuramate--alanine ligase
MSTEPQKIFMSGIGGIGMSGLAQLLVGRGDRVTGSDREESPTTELLRKKGIEIHIPQQAENVPEDAEVFVYSAALPSDNAERVRARELGIPELTYFAMLGVVAKEKRVVAVAGTNGKTTTTGMLGRILKDANAQATVVVGSIVKDFGSNYLKGSSDWFVVEACEYERHFLSLSPEILVVTNIEFDHTDYYKDLADVQNAFRTLMEKVPATGFIVTNPNSTSIAPLLEGLSATVVDYTKEPAYHLGVPGDFNVENARAAASVARLMEPSLSEEAIKISLNEFKGSWRRFESKGTTKQGALVFDDYAHHPTAIKATLSTLREKTEGKIYVAFHPHLYSRTKDLFDDFGTSFGSADEVLIAPIYAAREIDDGSVSSELLAERLMSQGVSARALSFSEIEDVLRTEPKEGDVIMTMGAGDIYKVADALTNS